jgi:hypothetical protein
MRKIYFIFLASCLHFPFYLMGQLHCSETLITTIPSINTWDWRTQYWSVNAYTNGGPGILTSVLSPFYSSDNVNFVDIATILVKDYEPVDGWELLKKNLGTIGEVPTTNAYAVFYNKYTAKIRVFFLVTQTFSNVGANGNSNALVSIYFKGAYQSNLLTTYTTPLLPLDKLRRDINIKTPNIFFNQLPYWLFSEFPVAYDPCTCGKEGQIRIELTLMDGANLQFDLNSVPYQSTVVNGQIDPSKDWVTSFSQFSGTVEGGVKAARSSGEAFGKLNDAVAKQTNVDLAAKLSSDLAGVKKVVDAVGSFASIIPVAGAAISSVVSLIDFFSSSGGAAGPSAVMIMNDFKAKGSITSEVKKNEITLALPGSQQANVDPAIKPVYNNILGSFNLLYTPGVTVRKRVTSNPPPYAPISKGSPYSTDVEYWISIDPDIKFVINPALDIDLSKSSIKASFVLEGAKRLTSGSLYSQSLTTNLQNDIEQSGVPVYRSSYFPLNSLNEAVGYYKIHTEGIYGISAGYPPNTPGDPIGKIYLKITAKLQRRGATNASQDIIFIAKYPTLLPTYLTVTQPVSAGLENIAEDINLPDNYAASGGTSLIALNTISLGSSTISSSFFSNGFLSLTAGESIALRAGAVITPNYSVKVGGIYSATAPALQSLQATSVDLTNFCGSSAYNGANNERNILARQAAPEEVQVLTKEEFFTFYPNPATDQVTFKYFIEESSQVRLSVIDLSGKPIGLLVDEYKEMGDYAYTFDSSGLPAGMYIIKFESEKLNRTEKLVVIK